MAVPRALAEARARAEALALEWKARAGDRAAALAARRFPDEVLVVTRAGPDRWIRSGALRAPPFSLPSLRAELEEIAKAGDVPVLFADPPCFVLEHLAPEKGGAVVDVDALLRELVL